MTGPADDGPPRAPPKLESRAARMISLLALLQNGARFNAKSLAEAFGVHRRTIFRDLAELRDLGIAVGFSDSTDGYLVIEERCPAGKLSADEVGMLLLAAKVSPMHAVNGASAVLTTAGSKLLAQYPKLVRDEIGNRFAACERMANSSSYIAREDLATTLEAILKRKTLRLRVATGADSQELELEPWRIKFSADALWLIGRSIHHRAAVVLDLKACSAFECGEGTFTLPRRMPRQLLRMDGSHGPAGVLTSSAGRGEKHSCAND